MATLADNFNRADSTNLGASWNERIGDVRIVNGTGGPGIQHVMSPGPYARIQHTGNLATANHGVQINLNYQETPTINEAIVGVFARANAADLACYVGRYTRTTGGVTTARIGRLSAAGALTLISSVVNAITTEDTIRLEVSGDQLTLKKNGVAVVGPVTDSTITAGTQVGFEKQAGNAPYDFTPDDFAAEDIAGPSGAVPTPTFLTLGVGA